MKLRLASYNIHKCVGTDRKFAPDRTVAVINSISADVIALQEADWRRGPRAQALPSELLASETDYVPLELTGNGPSLGWHGQTLLTRRSIDVMAIDLVSLPGLEPRGGIIARMRAGGVEFVVVALHLGLLRGNRIMQMKRLVDALSPLSGVPTALIGDFNEWSKRGGMGGLTARFRVHAPGPSFPAGRPVAALDRIALNPHMHLRDAGVVDIPLARRASDHLPIWADVRIDAQADD